MYKNNPPASLAESKVLALIPAYNEESHIVSVIDRTRPYLPVWVVDDGSKDQTARLAEEAGAHVLLQMPNQGKGQALQLGFREALAAGFDAVVMLDADGQHDPAEIPLFLERWAQTAPDLIIGSRDYRGMPIVRRTSNTIGRWMFSRALGRYIRDNQSGYRLLSRRMMAACLETRHGGFEFEVEMIVICVKNGWRLEEIPIQTIYGDQKSHITPLRHIQKFLTVVKETRKAMKG